MQHNFPYTTHVISLLANLVTSCQKQH